MKITMITVDTGDTILPFLGSDTVVPTTVIPDNSAARATAVAKSVSAARNEPSLELAALDLRLLQLVLLWSVTLAHDASMEPAGE